MKTSTELSTLPAGPPEQPPVTYLVVASMPDNRPLFSSLAVNKPGRKPYWGPLIAFRDCVRIHNIVRWWQYKMLSVGIGKSKSTNCKLLLLQTCSVYLQSISDSMKAFQCSESTEQWCRKVLLVVFVHASSWRLHFSEFRAFYWPSLLCGGDWHTYIYLTEYNLDTPPKPHIFRSRQRNEDPTSLFSRGLLP